MSQQEAFQRLQNEIQELAELFSKKYGSLADAEQHVLELAQSQTSSSPWQVEERGFNLGSFKHLLTQVGVRVAEPAELFDHIDIDASGIISVAELFLVLEAPLEQITRRERLQREEKLEEIYTRLAHAISAQFNGDIEEAVKKSVPDLFLEAAPKDLQDHHFAKFVKDLSVDLDVRQRKLAFDSLDEDRSGNVSIAELRMALGKRLVMDHLLGVAQAVVASHGSIDFAFDAICKFGGVDRSQAQSPMAGGAGNELVQLKEHQFVSLLHQLRIPESVLGERREVELWRALGPCSAMDLRLMLGSVQRLVEDRQAHEEAMKVAKAAERKDKSQKVAHDMVSKWEKQADSGTCVAHPEDVTRDWEAKARAGRSSLQLKDVVKAFDARIRELQDIETIHSVVASPRMSPRRALVPEMSPRKQISRENIDLIEGRRNVIALNERIMQAAATGDLQGVDRCLSRRCNPNCIAWGGTTPLMGAARHGRQEVLRTLLASRAHLDATDSRGRTAVDHACKSPAAKEWLRSRGGRSSKELAAEAAACAEQLASLRAERAKFDKVRSRMQHQADRHDDNALAHFLG